MSIVGVVIDIAAEYTGAPALAKASKGVAKLDKAYRKMGIAQKLTYAALTGSIVAYSKLSAKAAAQDQQQQAILAQSLKNTGLAYARVGAESFIHSLEQQTGILDDQLRPAYAQLARVTGSVLKTQDLMKLAFDLSAGTTTDYAGAVEALSQAYVGNYKGLKKLDLGLTQAELKAMSFSELQDYITNHFKGVGKASLEGYAGQMALLSVSTRNFSETVGASLLTNLGKLSGNKGHSWGG